MRGPVLSERLKAVASLVRRGSVVADVGTDHGYLITDLVIRGISPKGYATDIHELPLQKAKETIHSYQLDDKIKTVLADGLQGIPPNCAQDIVIAGMGGDMIAGIIEKASWLQKEECRLILQPMTKADTLRRFLYTNGYRILREKAVEDGSFVYTVMLVSYLGKPAPISEVFARIGLLPSEKTPAAERYILRQASLCEKKAAGIRLGKKQTEDASAYERLAEILKMKVEEDAIMKETCTVGDVYRLIDQFAPFSLAEDWDNPGLLVGSPDLTVTKALLAMDVTPAVIEEAAKTGAELIVTHHPVIFSPIKRVEAGSIVYNLIRNGISVISAHTNLDIAEGGVNDCLAECLGLCNIKGLEESSEESFYKIMTFVPKEQAEQVYQALCYAGAGALGNYDGCAYFTEGTGCFQPKDGANPFIGEIGRTERVDEIRLEMILPEGKKDAVITALKEAHPYETPAFDLFKDDAIQKRQYMGRIGELSKPMQPEEFAEMVKEKLGIGGIRYTPVDHPIKRVAVLGGAGADYIFQAKNMGADAFVTADTKHHLLLEANRIGIMLLDAGHFSTETVVMEPLCKRLQAALPHIAFAVAKSNIDPVCYR